MRRSGARSGWGEDSPLHEATLERDGWELTKFRPLEPSAEARTWQERLYWQISPTTSRN